MKKILFVLIFLNSFLFGFENHDKNNDLLTYVATDFDICKDNSSYPIDVLFHPDPLNWRFVYIYGNPRWSNSCSGNQKYDRIRYNATQDYQCPAGQEIINSSCSTPPACSAGSSWNSSTDLCSPTDSDGDGTPDKCDTSFANYASSDCDGDGIPNSTDNDIDGDGSANNMDVDENGDGIPDSSDPNSAKFNTACQGADFSTNTVFGVPHPISEYSYKGVMTPSSCLAQTDDPNIDGSLIFNDKNSNCYNTYCYIHTLASACNYYASDYIPDGNLWTRKLNVSSATQCASYVDNVLYSDKVFVVPDASACPDHKYCFLKRTLPTPVQDSTNSETSDSTMQSPDLNSTSADLSPLLQAGNTTNSHLQDLKDKTDITHSKLEDLKTTANSILNSSTDMSSTLSSIKTGVDRTASNSLEALSSLGSISDGISASNVASVATNANLIGIGDKIDTSNTLLTDIKNNSESINDSLNPDTSSLIDGALGYLNASKDVLQSAQSGFSQISSDLISMQNKIAGGFVADISSGVDPDLSFSFHGQTINLGLCGAFSQFAGVLYFLFTILFLITGLRFFWYGFTLTV